MPNYKRMMEKKTCAECSRPFEAPSYVKVSFCSRNCEKAAKKKKISKTCLLCKTDFITNRKEVMYCSKTCAQKAKIARAKSDAQKKYRAEYRKRPEVRERIIKYKREYRKRRR